MYKARSSFPVVMIADNYNFSYIFYNSVFGKVSACDCQSEVGCESSASD